MQPKILKNLPPVPMPMVKPKLPPGMPPPVPMAADPKEETLRQTILNAMMQKNPDLANMQEPGAMGAEGAPGMPPDQPPMDASEMMSAGPPGAPGASGLAPLPPAGPNPLEMAAAASPFPAGPQGVNQQAEDRFVDDNMAMDAQIKKNFANNRKLAAQQGVSPEQLQSVMPDAYTGGRPPPLPGSRQALIEAMMKQGM